MRAVLRGVSDARSSGSMGDHRGEDRRTSVMVTIAGVPIGVIVRAVVVRTRGALDLDHDFDSVVCGVYPTGC